MKTITITPLIAIFFCLPSDGARAEQREFRLSGHINWVDDLNGVLGSSVQAGMQYTAAFPFKSDTQDTAPSDPTGGSYPCSLPGIRLAVGAFNIEAPTSASYNGIGVLNASALDQLNLSTIGFDSSGFLNMRADVTLSDRTGNVFSSDALPLLAPPLTAFDYGDLFVQGYAPDWSFFKFDAGVESLSIVTIPEPTSLIAFLSAWCLLRAKTGMIPISDQLCSPGLAKP